MSSNKDRVTHLLNKNILYMSEKSFKIIGVGSPIVDSLAKVSEDFVAGIEGAKGGMELLSSDEIASLISCIEAEVTQAPGGSAGNTIFAMSRLGDKTTFLGKLGNCDSADFYKNELSKLGGNTERFKIGSVPNGRCVSLVTPDSERTMRTDLGAAMTLSPDEISAEDFKDCQHAHIEGYVLFNRDLTYKVLKSAKEAGCTISVDLASFEVVGAANDILKDLLKDYVDVVFANEDEVRALLGDREDYPEMAKELAKLCKVGVVKIGKDGSFVAEGDQVTPIEPVVAANAIDTTAAGDFWAAGFLHGWLEGKPHLESGKFGSILGANVVQVMGSVLSDDTWSAIKGEVN